MEKIGVVVDIKETKAVVQIERTGECGEKCEGCAGGCKVPVMMIEIENTLNVAKGDYVTVTMPASELIKSTFVMYTLPLIGFIVGIVAGIYVAPFIGVANNEVSGVVGGIIGIIISYTYIYFKTKKSREIVTLSGKIERFDMKR